MRTQLILSVALALIGASSTLAAQSRTQRPADERDDARRLARTIISRFGDDPDRPRLGVSTQSSGASDTLGILVSDVTPGGPADKAGVKAGDRLIAINGINLRLSPADAEDEAMQGVTMRRLTRELSKHTVGDQVELQLVREGQPQRLTVTTAAASALTPARFSVIGGRRRDPNRAAVGLGLGGSGSPRDTLGIFVTSVTRAGPAEKAGIEEGDRIAAINGANLRVAAEDVDDWAASSARVQRFHREMETVKAGDDVVLRVYRGGQPRTVTLKAVPAGELDRSRRAMIMFGDDASLDGFSFRVPPVPPVPPVPRVPPRAPDAPQPPDHPPLPPAPPPPPSRGSPSGALD